MWTLYRVPLIVGALLGAAFTAWAAHTVSAQQSPPGVSERTLRVVRTDTPLTIDGRLVEAAWQHAAVLPSLTQVEPNEGAAPSERTAIYLLYDTNNLYIGIRAYDTEPAKIVAKERQRDITLDGDDSIALALDPFLDRKHGYYFQVNPLGTRRDGLISPETDIATGELQYSADWDGIWYASAKIDAEGWTVEIAIPTRTLSFNPKQTAWGFNIERVVARKPERSRWTGAQRNLTVFAMGEAGELTGLMGMNQGLGLDIIPSTKGQLTRNEAMDDTDVRVKPSLDVFYKVTPSVTLGLTLNTDFAEAEVDERLVNLTRFPLFFPEKRAFFLQDANYFSFGGILQSPMPFFSRKIGLAPDGTPIDILAGVKATGRIGPMSFGLLDVQTEEFRDLPSRNLAVGRASLDVGPESSVGLVFTRGDPLSDGDNTVAGADFHYKTSDFLKSGEVLEAAGYVMYSTGTSGSGTAFGGRLLYPNFHWNGALIFDHIGQQFDPALGFVSLQGTRVYEAWLGPRWRVAGLDYMQLWPYLFLRTDLENRIIDSQIWLPQFEIATKSGDNLLFAPMLWVEQFFASFTLLPGVEVSPGTYSYWRFLIQVTTAATRPLSAQLSLTAGAYLDGNRVDVAAEITWRPVAWFNVHGRYEQNAIDLPGGAFTVHLAQLNVNFAFTPNLTWNVIGQYDNMSQEVGFNSRIRYTIKPGADIYLVFNQLLDSSGRGLVPVTEDLSTKVVWTYRF